MSGMDSIGVFIANLHQMLGHDKAAAFLGEDPLDKSSCILCLYDRGLVTKQEVQDRIGRPA